MLWAGVEIHGHNASTWEAEAEGSTQGHPGYGDPVSKATPSHIQKKKSYSARQTTKLKILN